MKATVARCALLILLLLPTLSYAEIQRMYGPYFRADGVHASRLLIHNKRTDLPVSVSIFLLLRDGRMSVADWTLQPKESRSLTIDRSLLREHRIADIDGGILVEYDFFESQPIDASVLVVQRNGSQYVVPVLRRDQVRGNTAEAVLILPDGAARAFVALQNTSSEIRTVSVAVEASGTPAELGAIPVPPQQTRTIALDGLLARAKAGDAAAVRVVTSGLPGDIFAAGAVLDSKERYAGRVRFNDTAHGEHNRVLRSQFLLLGAQDSALGLPSDASFEAKCALRNPTDYPKVVRPRLKWLENGDTRTADLQPVRLAPHEVRIIDLAEAQRRGEIAASYRFGTFEIAYEGEGTHVFAQLTSLDVKHGLVLDGAMTSHESHAVDGLEWSVRGNEQTLISITNAAPRNDILTIQLYADGQTFDIPPLALGSGQIALLNLRSLARSYRLPDHGTFSVRGSDGSKSAFRLERLMVSEGVLTAETASSGNNGPVIYVDLDGEERVLWIRTSTSSATETSSFPPSDKYVTLSLSTIARWSSGTATTDETNTTQYVTTSTDMLTVKQPPSPSVTVYITIRRPPSIGDLISRFYDPCSNQYLLTYQLRFGLPATAYEILSSLQYPICDYRPTCSGLCSTSLYSALAVNTSACFPPGQPYVQCYGLSINGVCVIRRAVCTYQALPGYCG